MRQAAMRKRNHKPGGTAADEFSSTAVFITPMLDMAFQLLTFFVFTYNPTPMESRFTIGLAKGNISGGSSTEKPRDKPKVSPHRETHIKPLVMIVAKAKEDRTLDSLDLVVGDTSKPIRRAFFDEKVPLEDTLKKLDEELRATRKSLPSENRIVIQSTPRLKWDIGMKLMDACRAPIELKTEDGKTKTVPLFSNVDLDLIRGR